MVELIIANFYYIAGSILLACFVGFVNWLNNFKTRQANAAAIFRMKFSNVLVQIRDNQIDPQTLLEERFLTDEAAVVEFNKYLIFNSKRFMKAWHEYQYHDGIDFRLSVPYSTLGGSIEQRRKNRELAVNRVNNLISYAKQV